MDINTLRDDIDSWEPVKWEGLPDIDLYMDQVVTYLRRQLALFQDDSEASLVTRSIREPGEYSSGTPLMPNRAWRKSAARFKQLDRLFRRNDPDEDPT